MDYKTAGVDIAKARSFVDRISPLVKNTHSFNCIGNFGGFSAGIRIPSGIKRPVIISSTDGVGTKLKLTKKYKSHGWIGIDLVAMCVNDVLTSGARPIGFLDYIAAGQLDPDLLELVLIGISNACTQAECALLGGETAEMPGIYSPKQFDLAGFCIGIVDESKLITGKQVIPGDKVIGIASNGVHSNGFTLIRKILKANKVNENTKYGKNERLLIRDILKPTQIYSDIIDYLLKDPGITISGMAHITGGGLLENLPRAIGNTGNSIVLNTNKWPRSDLFKWIQEKGDISEYDMLNTFNCGIGYALIVPPDICNYVLNSIHYTTKNRDYKAWEIGTVVEDNASKNPTIYSTNINS
tara:strand:+ start:5843 stop:6904 length:1062 start_codon:yes stop_codon:yes gene_type:complete